MISHRGFTLIETVIVLAMTSLCITFPASQLRPFYYHRAETIFLNQFDQAWHYSLIKSAVERDRVQVSITQKQVLFRGKDSGWSHQIILPETMRALPQQFSLSNQGHVSPVKITFHSDYFKNNTVLKPQMGWGSYE
ncbi:prepilin-type N-terminal cleavage/methylation domain-containing protein [Loigolactobacillus backii]|uniref:Uncharacterized protein n=1 Tax=Loigolactobacillus backii TaxID=375175 RepID=A0A192H4U7_9LACO|nr:prepilin-type N-terminal cleavage/methylation domain-containing protein [Loigolactobacillus backii]ANK59932.1 hypothetical protein AYR52_06445 [Loigolactobacillus backii]ANK63268.1 hypothetical protein AYR53_11110 [Loigolactobacillus backii]ANK64866.1 hypothetical protein AYR54_06125 [Loigolactobacillus backii]ANK66687.1 hypothetical protein AYR55_02630 [Loigolactobacillus backii]ANK69726.1 hypothetical protein AYR56_05895 [Loigolactobacillus backii]